jgi:hypothetical protein
MAVARHRERGAAGGPGIGGELAGIRTAFRITKHARII